MVGLTTVGTLVGGPDPWPSWLHGPGSCGGFWPAVRWGGVLAQLVAWHGGGRVGAGLLVGGAQSLGGWLPVLRGPGTDASPRVGVLGLMSVCWWVGKPLLLIG